MTHMKHCPTRSFSSLHDGLGTFSAVELCLEKVDHYIA